MKVLALCIESPDRIYGGMGEHIRQLYRHMDINVTLLTLDKVKQNKPYNTANPKFKNYVLPQTRYEQMLENMRQMTLEGVRLFQAEQYDIIHAHDWSSLQIALDLKELFGVKVVTTFHLYQHQIVEVEGIELNNETKLALRMEREGLFSSDKIIFCSNFMKRYADNVIGIKSNTCVIPNAIDTKEMQGKNKYNFSDKPTILFSGRFSKQKGIELIFDCIKRTDKYFWVLMGHVPTPFEKDKENHPYTKTIRKLEKRYPGRVRCIGFKKGQERWDIYNSVDIGIMPSLCEPYGIVALEFMANRIPLVTTGVDGMEDFVNNNNCVLIKPTSDSILAGLNQCEKIGKHLINNAYMTATNTTWRDIANQTTNVYKEVLKWSELDYQQQTATPISSQ